MYFSASTSLPSVFGRVALESQPRRPHPHGLDTPLDGRAAVPAASNLRPHASSDGATSRPEGCRDEGPTAEQEGGAGRLQPHHNRPQVLLVPDALVRRLRSHGREPCYYQQLDHAWRPSNFNYDLQWLRSSEDCSSFVAVGAALQRARMARRPPPSQETQWKTKTKIRSHAQETTKR